MKLRLINIQAKLEWFLISQNLSLFQLCCVFDRKVNTVVEFAIVLDTLNSIRSF